MNDDEQLVMRAVLAGVCAWELVALATPLPTITSVMRRFPPVQRAAILLLVGAALSDHFFTRRFVK